MPEMIVSKLTAPLCTKAPSSKFSEKFDLRDVPRERYGGSFNYPVFDLDHLLSERIGIVLELCRDRGFNSGDASVFGNHAESGSFTSACGSPVSP